MHAVARQSSSGSDRLRQLWQYSVVLAQSGMSDSAIRQQLLEYDAAPELADQIIQRLRSMVVNRCQVCRRTGQVAHVTLRQNIGMMFVRRSKTLSGYLCKECIQKNFVTFTATTLFLGWWGTISCLLTPTFIIANSVVLIKSFGMQAPTDTLPNDRSVPPPPAKLSTELMDKLEPFTPQIINRLNAQEDNDKLASDIAAQAGVTQAEVKLYISELTRVARKKQKAQ
jgi:hypothetical protein